MWRCRGTAEPTPHLDVPVIRVRVSENIKSENCPARTPPCACTQLWGKHPRAPCRCDKTHTTIQESRCTVQGQQLQKSREFAFQGWHGPAARLSQWVWKQTVRHWTRVQGICRLLHTGVLMLSHTVEQWSHWAWAGYSPESKRSACPLEFQSKRSVTTPTLRHMTVFKTKRENMQEVDKGTEHVPKHCGSWRALSLEAPWAGGSSPNSPQGSSVEGQDLREVAAPCGSALTNGVICCGGNDFTIKAIPLWTSWPSPPCDALCHAVMQDASTVLVDFPAPRPYAKETSVVHKSVGLWCWLCIATESGWRHKVLKQHVLTSSTVFIGNLIFRCLHRHIWNVPSLS